MSMATGIPVVDFSSLSLNLSDDELDESTMKMSVSEMMYAFSTTGFVYLTNTHFPDQLVYDYIYFANQKAADNIHTDNSMTSTIHFLSPSLYNIASY